MQGLARAFSRPVVRWLLGTSAALVIAGLMIPPDGCSTQLRFKRTDFSAFNHAVFICGSGREASLADRGGHPIDFENRLASRPERSSKELLAALEASRISLERAIGVPVSGGAKIDYDAYLSSLTREMSSQLRSGRKRHVLLWIHGGRNPLLGGPDRTLALVSALDTTEYYPVCVNWESSDIVSYWSHLTYCRPARVNVVVRCYRALKIPFLIVHDLGRGLARTPLGVYGDFSREATAFRTSRRPASQTVDGLVCSRGAMRSGAGRYLHPLLWLVSLPTRAVVSVIIHSGGPGEWESLRHSTQAMFQTDADLRETEEPVRPTEDSGAFSRFVEAFASALDTLNAGRESAARVDVTLIAHSMGTSVACEMLRHHADLPIRNIVFMAAACRVHEFFDVIVPYLANHPDARFFNLMLHPVNDLQETFTPIIGDFVYRGSLLTWIDDFLDTEESPLERTLGRTENALAATRLVPAEVRPRVTFKTFGDGADGDPSAWRYGVPRHHGDFSDPRLHFWEEDFWKPTSVSER